MVTLRYRKNRNQWLVDYRMDGVRSRVHFRDKTIAKKYAQKIEETLDLKKAGLHHIQPITFGDFINLFIENHFKTKSNNYYRSESMRMNNFLRFFGNKILISEITKADIVAYRNSRMESNRSNKTIINELGLLHKIFQKAIDNNFTLVAPEKPHILDSGKLQT